MAIDPAASPAHDGDLPADVAARFLRAATRKVLLAGQPLYEVGSAPRAMYGVISGELRVGVTGAGGVQFFATRFGPGRWFGEVPLLDGQARAYHVDALARSEVAVLAAADFQRIVHAHPPSLLAVTRLVCARYRWALGWIEDASLRPLPARLANRLLALRQYADDSGRINASQDELAAQLGVSRQSVNRQLKDWERGRIVQLAYAGLRVVDPAALRRIVGG